MLDEFPHLLGCLRNLSPVSAGKGLCFHRSTALVMDLPGSELVLGTFRAATSEEALKMPNASPVPFIHCWVEYAGNVIAPSLLETRGLDPMDREAYYRVNGARDIYRVSRKRIMALGLGPYFLTGKPDVALGAVLLREANLPHTISNVGTVLPWSKEL